MGNLWAAPATHSRSCDGLSARSTGCPHVFARAGPRNADSSTYPQTVVGVVANTLAQGIYGRLRRWIMLRCVDWLPPDFIASRSWPFSRSRDRHPGCPLGILPNAAGLARTRVLHTGPVCPESMCLSLFPTARSLLLRYALVSRRTQATRGAGRTSSWHTMSQMKPASSRAMATHTTLVFFPARVRVR